MPDLDRHQEAGPGLAPAPGSLRLVEAFAATLSTDPGPDLLGTRDEAAAWLHTEALLPAPSGLTNSEHAALLRLRTALRDVLAAHAAGASDADAAARLAKALAEGRLVVTLDPASVVHLVSAARASFPSVVAGLAVAIAQAAADGTWPHLKCCPTPGCGQIFYAPAASHCPAHATTP